MRKVFTTLFALFVIYAAAQVPVLNNVAPIATYPQNKILITGSGFATNPAQMQVWFDQVKGVIDVSASNEFSLTVTVPAQARLANIEVTNLVSGLSAKTTDKFLPFFSGDSFSGSNFVTAASFASSVVDDANDVCTCDLDGDGKPDMAATKNSANITEQLLLIYRNTSSAGSISFAASTINLAIPLINITCADLDGDGKPDLVANRGQSTRNEVLVLRNTSALNSISFTLPAQKLLLDLGDNAFRILTRDLNADGKPEIILTNAATVEVAGVGQNRIYIYTNQSSPGNISFSAPAKIAVTGAITTYGLDSQDLDGDGKPEIIVSQFNKPHFFILKNESAAGVISFPTILKINTDVIQTNLSLNHLTTGDFNNDGKLDIAVTNNDVPPAAKVFVYINQSTPGSISLAPALSLDAGDSPFGIDVADIDGDKDADIIAANLTNTVGAPTKELSVFLNNGSASFTKVAIPSRKGRNLKVGDLDGDGKPDIVYTSVGDHFVEVLRNKNCFVPSILNTLPLVICAGQTIRLNSIPSPTGTFSWQNVGNSLPANSNTYLDVTAADTYTVTATSESGACSKTAAVVVTSGLGTVPADPTITANSPVCSTGTINLSTTDVAPVYSWTGPNNFTSNQQNVSISNITSDNAGNYTLQLATASGCKSNIATKRIDVANLGNFVISTSVASNQVCAGSSVNLSVNFANGYSYQWIKDGVNVGSAIITSPVTLSVTQDGIYKAQVKNIALNCASETAPVTVSVIALPNSSFSASTQAACVSEKVTFTNNSTFDNRATPIYAWAFGDGTVSSEQNPSKIYASAATNTVQLTVSYSGLAGCSKSSTNDIVVTATPVVVALTADGLPVSGGSDVKFSSGVPVQLVASGASAYSWSPADGLNDAAIANPVATLLEDVIYTVTGSKAGMCNGTLTFNMKKIEVIGVEFSAPTAFSPNGDANHETWDIPNPGNFSECTISIFSKQGSKVFEMKGYTNEWNGTYEGKELPQGTYYYVLNCPNEKPITGHVLLAR
jgi:gliding motility-associated-like protein